MKHAEYTGLTLTTRRNGFTLIELITALTVLAVALAGLVAMFGISLETAREARMKTLAAEMAATQLAEIQATPESFLWKYDQANTATLFPIVLGNDDPKAGNPPPPPECEVGQSHYTCKKRIALSGIPLEGLGPFTLPRHTGL